MPLGVTYAAEAHTTSLCCCWPDTAHVEVSLIPERIVFILMGVCVAAI